MWCNYIDSTIRPLFFSISIPICVSSMSTSWYNCFWLLGRVLASGWDRARGCFGKVGNQKQQLKSLVHVMVDQVVAITKSKLGVVGQAEKPSQSCETCRECRGSMILTFANMSCGPCEKEKPRLTKSLTVMIAWGILRSRRRLKQYKLNSGSFKSQFYVIFGNNAKSKLGVAGQLRSLLSRMRSAANPEGQWFWHS